MNRPDKNALLKYGFCEDGGGFSLKRTLGVGLELTLRVDGSELKSTLFDPLSESEYILHRVEDASGAFVGEVRAELAAILSDVEEKCFLRDPYLTEQPRLLAEYISSALGGKPEYLWKNFPTYAVWRREENGKWYALVGRKGRKSLGAEGEGEIDILDVRMDPARLDFLVDGKRYFRGWHMNKRRWCAVPLDGTLPFGEICKLVQESYLLAKK